MRNEASRSIESASNNEAEWQRSFTGLTYDKTVLPSLTRSRSSFIHYSLWMNHRAPKTPTHYYALSVPSTCILKSLHDLRATWMKKKKRECSVLRRSSRTLHQLLTRDRVSRRRNPLRFSLLGTTPYSSAHNCDGREWWEREAFFLRSPHAHTISHESIIALVALVALKNCEESQESARLISPRGLSLAQERADKKR